MLATPVAKKRDTVLQIETRGAALRMSEVSFCDEGDLP
jgi:hypothetical protein